MTVCKSAVRVSRLCCESVEVVRQCCGGVYGGGAVSVLEIRKAML